MAVSKGLVDMAVLSDQERASVSRVLQQDVSSLRDELGSLTKADLLAAVNALDEFLETNKTAINNAIPQPARSELTVTQKARLLVYVIRRRFEVGA